MKQHLSLSFIALAAAALFSPASSGRSPPDRATLEFDAVQQTLYDAARALERNDADALKRYYAREFLSVDPTGASLVSGERFTATRNGTLHYDSIEIAEPITRVHGRAAVSTSHITVRGHNQGQDISGAWRVTTMLAKEGGGWRIVALVSSPADRAVPAG